LRAAIPARRLVSHQQHLDLIVEDGWRLPAFINDKSGGQDGIETAVCRPVTSWP
jgi:hypothetical protein